MITTPPVIVGEPVLKLTLLPLTAAATVLPTGSRTNLSSGTVTITADATVLPTGSRVNLATSDVLIRKWDGIVPGVSMTWDSATFPEKRA